MHDASPVCSARTKTPSRLFWLTSPVTGCLTCLPSSLCYTYLPSSRCSSLCYTYLPSPAWCRLNHLCPLGLLGVHYLVIRGPFLTPPAHFRTPDSTSQCGSHRSSALRLCSDGWWGSQHRPHKQPRSAVASHCSPAAVKDGASPFCGDCLLKDHGGQLNHDSNCWCWWRRTEVDWSWLIRGACSVPSVVGWSLVWI